MVNNKDRRRLAFLFVFLCLLFSLLIVRFYQIQIVDGEKWVKIALSQHQTLVVEPFMRGSFYSNTSLRKGGGEELQPLVFDIPKFHLFIDPDSIQEECKEKMAHELSKLLGVSSKRSQELREEFFRKSRSRKLAPFLDRQTKEKVLSWWISFAKRNKLAGNALYFSFDYQRLHPFGSLLGSVLHTVRSDREPYTMQAIPTGGLEMAFQTYLQGKQGKSLVVRSPSHSIDQKTVVEEPLHGADVYLTINHHLQAIVEKELKKGVLAAGAKGGWAVMMDPYTGEILALAQDPSFDPEHYNEYFNNPLLQEATRVKAVSDCFEPGSILKPITLAICLKANEELALRGKKPIFLPEEKVPTSEGWFPGRSTPLKDGRLHKFLNMNLAVQKSSNVYVARIVQRLIETMGEAWYRRQLEETFGFGIKTQVEIPSESAGLLPTPGKIHPNGKLEWSVPTPYSLAMGYNILVNSLQMVRAYAVLANGGILVRPHIVKKIARKDQKILRTERIEKKEVLSSQIAKRVVVAMKYTTKEGGTAKRADIPGYTEAGKSGTAEKLVQGEYSKQCNISSFLGLVPAEKPRFVLLVSIDEPEIKLIPGIGKQQQGGVCAAPVFREISIQALGLLGVDPDDPYGYFQGDPRRNPDKADWIFEVNELKKIYQQWNEL